VTEEPVASAGPGVGPWPGPWPDDPAYDPELLEHGDRRNVVDRYRYWRVEAIVADLDRTRPPLHVAIAFNVAEVHIVGRRRWNRRGAMVTDRYLHVRHHADIGDLAAWAGAAAVPLIGIDNVPGATPIESAELPRSCCLVFGQESDGLTDDALAACARVLAITQFGSTRSINAGAAGAIAMHAWIRAHAALDPQASIVDRSP
jgi:tRNA(Leu) C34 or U34 (ribose-2'-O)-methylase TrmL